MADKDPTRDGGPEKTVTSRKKAGEERPFDRWLQKQLHAMYDEIASEPLPDDLLELIQRDAAQAAPAGSPKPNGSSDKK